MQSKSQVIQAVQESVQPDERDRANLTTFQRGHVYQVDSLIETSSNEWQHERSQVVKNHEDYRQMNKSEPDGPLTTMDTYTFVDTMGREYQLIRASTPSPSGPDHLDFQLNCRTTFGVGPWSSVLSDSKVAEQLFMNLSLQQMELEGLGLSVTSK